MRRKLSAICLLAAWLAATSAWAQSPKVVLVQGRALVDVESLSDEFGNRVMPIEPDESPTEAMNKATVNTAAINRYLSKFGSSTGETRGLYLNGRLYAINDTIIEGTDGRQGYGGVIIDGGGGLLWANSRLSTIRFNAATYNGSPIQSAGGFVWVGNPANGAQPYTDRPMIKLRGFGSQIENCNFLGWPHVWDGVNASRPTRAGDMVKTAIEISYVLYSVPSGKHSLVDNAFTFCQAAYRLTGVSHADNCYFGGKQIFTGCRICLACEGNNQALGFVGDSWEVNGPFDPVKVCSFDHGGKVHIDALKMVASGTIFETFGASRNESDFSVDRLWWDTNSLVSDGLVYAHIYFNSGPNESQPFNYSATCNGTTTLTLSGLTAKAADVGLLLVITGGTGGWVLNDDAEPYVVEAASDGGSTWTLDRAPSSGSASAMVGHAGYRSNCRLVDMNEVGPAYFDISGHLAQDGDTYLPNMVRIKEDTDHKPPRVRLAIDNLHRATTRAYPMGPPTREPAQFVIPTTCKLFLDLHRAWDGETAAVPLLDYTGKSGGLHGDFNRQLLSLNDLSATGNHLSAFSTGMDLYNWAMHGGASMVGGTAKGMRRVGDSEHPQDQQVGLTGLTALSVGGVIRRQADWSGNQAIVGVWYPAGSQKSWDVDTTSAEIFRLWLSSNGTADSATITWPEYTIPADRNIPFYITWDGTTAKLYTETSTPSIDKSASLGALFSDGTAPLYVGCTSATGTTPNNPFTNGVIGCLMVDNVALSEQQVRYRFEEFAARYGTPLNTDLAE